jgi:hypothetical protein
MSPKHFLEEILRSSKASIKRFTELDSFFYCLSVGIISLNIDSINALAVKMFPNSVMY